MKRSVELKQQRAQKMEEANSLLNAAKNQKRDLTPEEATQVENLENEITALERQMDLAIAQERIELRNAKDRYISGEETPEEREVKRYSLLRHLQIAGQGAKLDGFEAEMQQEAEQEYTRSGVTNGGGNVLIPSMALHSIGRDMTATGGSPAGVEGGYNVETTIGGYIEALRERNMLMELGVGFMDGLVGNIDMPRENAVANFVWEAENGDADETNPTYTKVSLRPKRLTGFIDVSLQLLRQTSPSIETRVRNMILAGHATALDKAGFAGTGSPAPTGILNDSGVSVHAIGANGGALNRAGIVALEELLRNAFGANGASFVTNNKVRRVLKTTALDAGSGLFLWDRVDQSVEGYSAFATTHIPSDLAKGEGTNLSAAILGSFNQDAATFAQWGGLEILVNPFTKAKNGIVEMILHAYNDFAVLQPKRFAVVKDITTS